jgi:hypothetical protein
MKYLWLLLFLAILYLYNNQEGFTNYKLSYGALDNDIAIGNPVSWSNRINRFVDKNKKMDGPFSVYQGTPIPLKYEDRMQKLPKNSMFYFANYKCSPECCPSPYSCDHGCVCFSNYSVNYGEKPLKSNKLNFY